MKQYTMFTKIVEFVVLVSIILLCSALARGTTVTGTLVDSTGQALVNANMTTEFVPAPGTYGSPTIPSQTVSLDSNGGFTITLTANNTIVPSGSTYKFTICPNATVQCSIVSGVTIAGASQNISTVLNAGIAGISVTAQALIPKAYSDAEINTGDLANTGALYFNTLNNTIRFWGGTGWTGLPSLNGTQNFSGSTTFGYVPVVGSRYPGLQSFGDSITCGFLATTGYPTYVVQDVGGTLTNNCRNGDMAADGARVQVYPNTNPGYTRQPTYTYALGINDSTSYLGNTDKQQITITSTYASLAWLGIPSRNKVFGQDASITKTGAWSNDDTIQVGLGTQSSTVGNNLSIPITTTGGPIYIGYRIFDGGTASASLLIDGTNVGTLNAYGFNHAAIATTNGTTDTVALFRYPIVAGAHTVSITLTAGGTFSFLWAGTTNALPSYASPRVYVGSVTREQADANEPLNSQYNTMIQNIVNTLSSDGLRIYWVDTRSYLNTTTDLADLKHPNDTGQQHMRDAFAWTIQPVSVLQTSAFTTPITVTTAAAANTNNFTNFNAGNVFNQTLLNPGILLYRGTGREMGFVIGSQNYPNPQLMAFAPDNAHIDFCHHIGGVSPTVWTDFVCNMSYAYNSGSGMLTVSNLTVTGAYTGPTPAFSGSAFTPALVNTSQLGSSVLPWTGLQLGTSGTNRINQTVSVSAARPLVWRDIGTADTPTQNITGIITSNLTGATLTTGTCTTITLANANVLATDIIPWAFNGTPSVGFNSLVVTPYATAGNANFMICNHTAGSVTFSTSAVNWSIKR